MGGFRRSGVRKAWGGFILLLAGSIALCACGYRVRSSVAALPSGAQSIGIPTFRNSTTQYKIEQLISRAVLKEFTERTRASVNSSGSGVDLVLRGEIRDIKSIPVTFGTQNERSQTTGSALMVTVQLSVQLVRLNDSKIIWKNDNLIFSERHIINSEVREFFSEENPALERLARSFASSLASAILNRSKP